MGSNEDIARELVTRCDVLSSRKKMAEIIAKAIADAVLAEREACAKLCEEYKAAQETPYTDTGSMWRMCAATWLAEAIRARGVRS